MLAAATDVPLGVTLLFTGLLVLMVVCLALEEKLHAKKSVIVGVFAALALFLADALHYLPKADVVIGGHQVHLPIYIPGIDWNVIALILGASLFVEPPAVVEGGLDGGGEGG